MRPFSAVAALILWGCASMPAPVREGESAPAAPFEFELEPGAPNSTLALTFAPPTEGALVEESVITRSDRDDHGVTLQESVHATLTSRFTALDGGWQLSQRMPEVKVVRNGKAVEDPLMEVVRRLPIDVALTGDGRFVRLTSGEKVAPAVTSVFTQPEQAAVVMRMFQPAAIEEQARREWEGKAAALLARPLVVGEPVRTEESLALGDGREQPYLLTRTPRGYTKTEFGRAAVLALSCESPDAGPTVECEGQQVVAADRFVPVLWWMRLRAREAGDGGTLLSLDKTVRTTRLEGSTP